MNGCVLMINKRCSALYRKIDNGFTSHNTNEQMLGVILTNNAFKTSVTKQQLPNVQKIYEKWYVLDEIAYRLFTRYVNWYNAKQSCVTYGKFGKLAIIDTDRKQNFLLEVLLQSDLYAHNVWIGNLKFKQKLYMYCGELIVLEWNESNNTYKENKSNSTCPSFLGSEKPNNQILLVNCTVQQFYLCQQEAEKRIESLNWIQVEKRSFAVVDDKVTWKEAANSCVHKYNAYLANFQNTSQIEFFFTKGSLKQIDAWVGAYYNYNHWRYLSTGKADNKNLFIRDDVIIKKKRMDTNCLALRTDQTLLPAKCTLKKGYICAKDIPEKKLYSNSVCYIIFVNKNNWLDAQKVCQRGHSWLVELTTNKKVADVLSILNNLPIAKRFFWIGSKFSKTDKWTWTHNKTHVQLKNVEMLENQETNLCLSIDRQSEYPHIYSTLCSNEQYFVCEKENITESECTKLSSTFAVDFDASNHSTGTTKHHIEEDLGDGAYNDDNLSYSLNQNTSTVVKEKETKKLNENIRLDKDNNLNTLQESMKTSTANYDNNQSSTNALHFDTTKETHIQSRTVPKNAEITLECSKLVKDLTTNSSLTFKELMTAILIFISCWIKNLLNEYDYIKQFFLADLLKIYKDFPVLAAKKLLKELLVMLINSIETISNMISDNEQSFVYNEIEYTFINIPVNWEEANIICSSYGNGGLTIAQDLLIRDFLGLALAESNLTVTDFWIGAKMLFNLTDGFYWVNGETPYKPDKYFIRRGAENIKVNRTCLAFSIQYHDIAHFINLDCQLDRGFICQTPYEKPLYGSLTTVNWISIDTMQYGIFYDKRTWYESVRECNRKHNAHLASFSNIKEIKIISKFLLIGRPSLERVWIGGQYKDGNWIFVFDETEIPRKTDEITKFPPWRFNRTIRQSGCLLLDRHLNKTGVFIENRCNQLQGYVCVRKKQELPDRKIIIINNIGYVFYYTKKTWEDALETCNKINANMIKVTHDILHDVTYMMAEYLIKVQHIWIGGRLSYDASFFYWVEDNEQIPKTNDDIDRFPPWFMIDYDPNYACLNLDIENHNRPMFYGSTCDYPQEFICVLKNVTILEELINHNNIAQLYN
ncbi:hypothetical protein RN001_004945 [Aquatica leii]|uniref:C-type lectin domain-containing protein n=1 Tax=Aquatica leii TaxID=1421715 RepID=A0AAN7SAB7_9COLE|nr:hypothetical protein RN001_004945 [Aquatica leii]